MARTIVGLFDNATEAQIAVRDLVQMGIAREDIGVMGHRSGHWELDREAMADDTAAEDAITGAGVGAALGGIGGFLMGLAVLPIPGIGPVIAAGPIIAALAGMGVGAATGGLIGVLTDVGVPATQAQHYAEAVRRGGTLLTVLAPDDQATHVSVVMARRGAVDINARATDWRTRGWQGYDPAAQPFTAEEVAREQALSRRLDADGGRVIIPVTDPRPSQPRLSRPGERRSREPAPPSMR